MEKVLGTIVAFTFGASITAIALAIAFIGSMVAVGPDCVSAIPVFE